MLGLFCLEQGFVVDVYYVVVLRYQYCVVVFIVLFFINQDLVVMVGFEIVVQCIEVQKILVVSENFYVVFVGFYEYVLFVVFFGQLFVVYFENCYGVFVGIGYLLIVVFFVIVQQVFDVQLGFWIIVIWWVVYGGVGIVGDCQGQDQ